jgi:hypothetical protein
LFSEAELVALWLLLQRPNTTIIPFRTVLSLLEKGLVERRAGSLILTSRGHAALLNAPSDPAR